MGILFTVFILPLLDGFTSLIITLIEDRKAKIAISIQKSQIAIEKCQNELESPTAHAIGFDLSGGVEEEDYD